MINTERNRALLTDLFAALGREGWGEVFLAALRDDAVFNAMGRSPIAGHYEGKRVYSEEVLAKLHDRLFVRPTLVVDKSSSTATWRASASTRPAAGERTAQTLAWTIAGSSA